MGKVGFNGSATHFLRRLYAGLDNPHGDLTRSGPKTAGTAYLAGGVIMLDAIFVAGAIVFFVLGVFFVRGCEAM